jgi:hypothetical protein
MDAHKITSPRLAGLLLLVLYVHGPGVAFFRHLVPPPPNSVTASVDELPELPELPEPDAEPVIFLPSSRRDRRRAT